MFPVEKRFLRRFRTEGNPYYEKVQAILNENTALIVDACQAYLDRYEREGRPRYAVDIDRIIALLEKR